MAWGWPAWTGALVAGALLAGPARGADISGQLVELAGQGRNAELAQQVDALPAAQRSTGEQHALCHALSRLKRYGALFACLDRLQALIDAGDARTLLFGLDDATPALHLMRSEALIDLGRLREALDEAAATRAWFEREGGPGEIDLLLDAEAATVIAAAGLHDDARAGAALRRLQGLRLDTRAAARFVTVRSLALARAHTALRQYGQACEALDEDRDFQTQRSIERLLHGYAPNWIWQELPRNALRARCLLGSGQVGLARERYDELLALPGVDQNDGLYWRLLFDRGRIHEMQGEDGPALARYREAIGVIERMRASIDTEASKIGFVADKQEAYGAAIALLARLGRADETLEIMERAKARALVDLLADRFGGSAPALDRGEPGVGQLLERQQGLEDALREQAPPSRERSIPELRQSLHGLNEGLRRSDPDLASLVAVEPVSAASLEGPAGPIGPEEVAVEFHLVQGQLYTVTTSGGHSHVHAAAAPELATRVRELRGAILDGARPERTRELGQGLYDLLLRPLEPEIGRHPLLLVPHGELNALPFAALHDGHEFLAWRQSLRLAPSMSALRYLHRPGSTQAPTLLAVADPTLDLPGAAVEAREVARISAGSHRESRILAGAEATKEEFLALAPGFTHIHFAGHGRYDPERPLESRLYFSRRGPDRGELRVGEVYGLRLHADLMTMSACESGLGRVAAGSEVIGLTRGFLYAGARSVVATLWEISDEATLALMEDFYRNLATMDKREALRAAQIHVARKFPEPYYWAAFFLSGAPD